MVEQKQLRSGTMEEWIQVKAAGVVGSGIGNSEEDGNACYWRETGILGRQGQERWERSTRNQQCWGLRRSIDKQGKWRKWKVES